MSERLGTRPRHGTQTALDVLLADAKPENGLAGLIYHRHLPFGIRGESCKGVAGQISTDRNGFPARGIITFKGCADDVIGRRALIRHMEREERHEKS